MERTPHLDDAKTIDEAYAKAGERVLKFAQEVVEHKMPVMCFALNPEGGVHAVQIVGNDDLPAMVPNIMLAMGRLMDEFLGKPHGPVSDGVILLTTVAYTAQQLVRNFPDMDPTFVLRVITEALTEAQLGRRPDMNPTGPLSFH